MYSSTIVSLLSVAFLAAQPTVASHVEGYCPIIGAVLPTPKTPGEHPAVKAAIGELQKVIDNYVKKLNVSAVSVAVKSIHEAKPLLDFHYTPPILDSRATKKVDGDSVYRLGSISKIFPVLSVLKLDGVSLDDKVTKYLPELRELKKQQAVQDAVSVVDWEEVTLGALAAHLTGIGRDYAIDIANFGIADQAPGLGLPPKENVTMPGCAGIGGTKPCTKDDFFARFGQRPPVFAPFGAPAYSNIGTPILSFIIEKLSGLSYNEFFKQRVTAPLGLNNTSGTPPQDLSKGVIPINDTWFTADIGFENPAGGFYSSPHDLLAFADAVLSSKLLTPAQTRKWLKPMTNTASLGTQLGAPWEIFRATNVTRDKRPIEIITKGGDLFNYRTGLALVPDYDLVWVILGGGNTKEFGDFVPTIQAAATKILLPAFEQASKDEADREYAGVYTDEATNSTMVLEIDPKDAGPGMRVSKLQIRGFDVLNNYPLYGSRDGSKPNPMPLVRLRLSPSMALATEKRESWRGVWTVGKPEELIARDEPFPWADNWCMSWATTDSLVLGLQALDNFIINRNKYVHSSARGIRSGCATSIEYPAFKITMTKAPRSVK